MELKVNKLDINRIFYFVDRLGFKATRDEWFVAKDWIAAQEGMKPEDVSWVTGWPCVQTITSTEANGIADALDRFLTQSDEGRRSFDPEIIRFPELAEYFCSQTILNVLRQFVKLCRAGGFTIEFSQSGPGSVTLINVEE